MSKSYLVHMKNKYPSARVSMDDDKLDVYSQDGEHLVALRKNGSGQWVDCQHELGARDAFCLSPIPKEARAWKLFKDGKVGKAEEYEERIKVGLSLEKEFGCVKGA